MQDLGVPLLTARIVRGLTGLSAAALRRWEAAGVPAPRSRRFRDGRARCPRLYSWREVEQLQQATHLRRTTRLAFGEVGRLLQRRPAARRAWVIARPKPRPRRERPAGARDRAIPTRRGR